MNADLLLSIAIGVLFAVGVYLMMSKNLIKVAIGFLLIGHGTNLLILAAGAWGVPPILGEEGSGGPVADPLPQAFVLTSIVITVAVSCFLLALIYRQYQHTRRTEIPEDVDDVMPLIDPGGDE